MSDTELKPLFYLTRYQRPDGVWCDWKPMDERLGVDFYTAKEWNEVMPLCSLTAAQEAIARLEAERDELKAQMARDADAIEWATPHIETFIAERDTARTELAELRKTLEAVQMDSKRLQHLIDNAFNCSDGDDGIALVVPDHRMGWEERVRGCIDAAIDAADAASGKGSEHG